MHSNTSTATVDLLLRLTNGALLITLPQACQLAGFNYKSERNYRTRGVPRLPTRQVGKCRRPLVHVLDLAAIIDGRPAQMSLRMR